MGLIDGDGGERPVRLVDGEIPSSEFLGYFRMCRRKFHHVSQMHRNLARVVDGIQGMEPHSYFSEGIGVHRKRRLAQIAHVHQDCQFQLEYSCPVVELGASLRLLLAPISQLITITITIRHVLIQKLSININ